MSPPLTAIETPPLLGEFPHPFLPPSEQARIHASGSSLTAAELHERASLLARNLRSLGCGPGVFVGIGLDRSLDLMTALLAVVQAGAAYIPLDPSYPETRLAHMIGAAPLPLVITRKTLSPKFLQAGAPQIFEIDTPSDTSFLPDLPEPSASPDAPLYAIFTSGSTGQPKAASVFRKGFANLLDWYTAELSLGPDDCTLVISSPSFDLTQKNLFAPLRTGGRLVLDDQPTYDISRILRLIRDHRVTLVNCTPSAFYPLVDAAAAGDYAALATLRFAVLGGEPISIPRLRPWLEHPDCRAEVVNTYGPTECTDICLFHRLHRGNLDACSFVPLGREIPNVAVSIRDENLAPLPEGETGELCISGAGLGGGYLHDPVRTAERFISSQSSTPLYRTGDLARRLPCGLYEFRGRADHQVKINGFRIELGEIEIALSRHPQVREAIVLARDNRLIAHIQGDPTPAVLKDHLSALLPAYMIPGEYRFRESFPLTPNGKIDRLALAASHHPQPQTLNSQPPTLNSPLTARILALWSEILSHSVTDPIANFFDLGGTSIHLAVVHHRLREISGHDLAITDLFSHPSAASLAAFLSEGGTRNAERGSIENSEFRVPTSEFPHSPTAADRARLRQAGFNRFRRPR